MLQCQVCIGEKEFDSLLRFVKKLILNKNSYVFLCTVKKFSNLSRGLLSFPKIGYTIAMDFEDNLISKNIIHKIYNFTLNKNGTVYLCKDSLLTKEQFRKSNINISRFKKIKKKYDKNCIFTSLQSERIGL